MSIPEPQKPHSSGGRRALVLWAVSLAVIAAYAILDRRLPFLTDLGGVSFAVFIAWALFIAISLYGITVAFRWLLRKLFWRVGRRLLLSYVMIGVLPFFLMTVLLLVVGYMIAGVMSHAALRGERQATLGQMESWALEYGLTGEKPGSSLPSLEIRDTKNGSGEDLPTWLRSSTFSGMVWRDKQPVLVSSRQVGDDRTIVFAQPIDENWAEQLKEKAGMIITYDEGRGYEHSKTKVRIGGGKTTDYDIETDAAFQRIFAQGFAWNRVIWADTNALTDWKTGNTDQKHLLVTFISTPVRNLFQFYFGAGSTKYLDGLVGVIIGIVVMMMVIYMIAALFAGVLIFSISRAVNRIEKGTKAVERGDFSYRIRMKPHNQLGEMAVSFDRMTESIASLLTTVAEKERLQSEIAIAATIQRNLLPKEGPKFRGVSFAAHFEPTTSIGGDYYDVFNIDKTRLAVAIGDVSGHGLSTGLVMAMVKAAITTLVEEGTEEDALFHRLNELVFRSVERRAFMTLAFTTFDLERGHLRHTNAGHLYPYLLREGVTAPIAIESPSLPLGVRHEITVRTVEMDLKEGDSIVYLSDGIVEAQNEEGDPLGFDQLESLLAGLTDRSTDAVRDAILDAVARHSGTRPADDDRTVMVLRFDQFHSMSANRPLAIEPAAV
ncbi:MAG: SpoIIE family protein phosphatase [Thermoanaerobaculia bacterium]|nr:SpoIIE family protein phosphatase [Thermoanaerobaculia bacterium]